MQSITTDNDILFRYHKAIVKALGDLIYQVNPFRLFYNNILNKNTTPAASLHTSFTTVCAKLRAQTDGKACGKEAGATASLGLN
jgi:hypothetical protein